MTAVYLSLLVSFSAEQLIATLLAVKGMVNAIRHDDDVARARHSRSHLQNP